MKKKILGLVVVFAMTISCIFGCGQIVSEKEVVSTDTYESLMSYLNDRKKAESLTCWYTDENDREWILSMSENFEEEYGVSVDCVYYDGASLFDDINAASLEGRGPSVYICGNDQIGLAKNSGMTEANETPDARFFEKYYPKTAIKAMTYQGKTYGYPLYFDTYCLVYDANLLETAPETIEDILIFADEYSDTGSTKAILRWDVADAYINNMFVAGYANLFGENGDEENTLDVSNAQVIRNMEYFQSLSEYLWMDKNNISHDTVKNRILEKTLVLGFCKTDILPILEELSGDDEVKYETAMIPNLTSEMKSVPFSTTYLALVNPYCEDESLANMFACYLSLGHTELQYEKNKRLSVVKQEDSNEALNVLYSQYLETLPVPKVMILGDYMSESAIAFDRIWKGEDAAEEMKKLQNVMDERMKVD